MLDSGNIVLEVSVPSISGSFQSGRNFYSSQTGKLDYTRQAKNIQAQSEQTLHRLDEIAEKVDDPRLEEIRTKLEAAQSIKPDESDPETAKQAMDHLQDAKRLLALTRKEHLKSIRQIELDQVVELFDEVVCQFARPTEVTSCNNLAKTAQGALENNSNDFESLLGDLLGRNFAILWRQDWFVVERFKTLVEDTHLFSDSREHARLVALGNAALQADDMESLRSVVIELDSGRINSSNGNDLMAVANIVRG